MDGSVAMSGHVVAQTESGRFIAAVTEGCEAAVYRAVDEGESLAKITAPKGRTLELFGSIKGVVLSATSGVIVALAPHAIFQEEGAGAHLIPSLLRGGPTLLAGPDLREGVVQGPVEHPGNPATHFLREAGQVVASYFPQYLEEALP